MNCLSRLTLGTAQFGFDYGISNKSGKIPQSSCHEIIETAYKSGIRSLDTAQAYGESEQVIGNFLNSSSFHFQISSKLPFCSPDQAFEKLELSLKNLGQKNLYSYFIHSYTELLKDHSLFRIMENLRDSGYFLKTGISIYRPSEFKKLLEIGFIPDIIQIPFNVFDQTFTPELNFIKSHGVEIHVRSVFLQGLVFLSEEKLLSHRTLRNALPCVKKLKDLCDRKNIPVAAVCLCFPFLISEIDRIVIGIESIDNLRENIADLSYLDAVSDIYEELSALKSDDDSFLLPYNWKE